MFAHETGIFFQWIDERIEPMLRALCEEEGLIYFGGYDRGLPEVAPSGDPVADLIARLAETAGGETYLLLGHPTYDGEDAGQSGNASYPNEQVIRDRIAEHRMLTAPEILAYCEANGIAAVRYTDV